MPSSEFNPKSVPDLSGKVYLVTGGNAGIGKETVAGLVGYGARVYMGARSESKADDAIRDIRQHAPGADIRFLHMDLSNLASVVDAARNLRRLEPSLHGLINNAGIMGVPLAITDDGYESQFQVNYLAHWLLTYHLLPLLQKTAENGKPGDVRIVNVTSVGHKLYAPRGGIKFDDVNLKSAGAMTRYGQSKLANVLHAKELNRRIGPQGAGQQTGKGGEIWVAAVHPGNYDTGLVQQATATPLFSAVKPLIRVIGLLEKDQSKGAWSSLFAVASADFKRASSGSYIVPYARIAKPSAAAQDANLAAKLWAWTTEELEKRGLLAAN